MPTVREQLVTDINNCRGATLALREVSRKIFVLDPTYAFKDDRILGFKILNSIAERFRVPLGCVKIAGSAQTGFSSFKDRDFVFGESDLDVAIVSPSLFQRYCEIVYDITNGYLNFTKFDDKNSQERFQGNLQLGFFRPDLMPNSKEKTEWFTFFNSLTDRYSAVFKSVNGGIYFSERFFEGKQLPALEKLIRV